MIPLDPVIDFHSHVLPGIDDGSASLDESIAMLQMAAGQGITHIVATPHFYPAQDDPQRFLDRRDRAEEKLRREMAKYSGLPELFVGAEVYFFRGMSHSEVLPLLTIQEKKCIMIEMPHTSWGESFYRELWQIHSHFSLVPIIAHIDRYISPVGMHRTMKQLEQLPVMIQANADAFLKKKTAAMATKMAKTGQIHLLGSDCHNLDTRKPNLGPALQVLHSRAGAEAVEHIRKCGKELLEL